MICFQLDGCNASGHKWAETGLRVRKSSFSNLKAMSDVTPDSQCTGKKQKNEIEIDFKQAHKAR